MNNIWHLIEDPELDGVKNMAIDEELFYAIQQDSPPLLRFYGWSPSALSLGYFQDISELPQEYASLKNCTIVKRITGGGAILHTPGELTISFFYNGTCDYIKNDISGLYEFFISIVKDAMSNCNIELERAKKIPVSRNEKDFFCFNRREKFDLIYKNAKIFGCAQRRIKGKIMLHGSLLLQNNETLKESIPFSFDKNSVREYIKDYLRNKMGIEFRYK